MHIVISNQSGKPIYEQIAEQVKALIISGELGEGDALPSMRLLAKELRISVITTKHAYEDLEREGFLVTMPGKGSFVAPQSPELHREEMRKQVEDHLQQAIDAARRGGITRDEVLAAIQLLWEDT